MVPLRALAERFGYDVTYQEKDRKIIILDADGENELLFTIGSTKAYNNGKADTMLQAPVIRDSRTFIPLRYVSEFFGKHVTWKKGGIDGKTIFVWISAVQLLTEDDVAAEKDDNYRINDPYDPMFYYVLKTDGQTYRGIKIGDTYEKIVELYGEPHKKENKEGVLFNVKYCTEAYPFDDPGSTLVFYFTDGFVDYVGVDGR
jgi:hypothetical protein